MADPQPQKSLFKIGKPKDKDEKKKKRKPKKAKV